MIEVKEDMNTYINENNIISIFNYKVVDISVSKKNFINNNNLCWFCNMKCSSYVKICENCKYDKYDKVRKNKSK